MPTFYSEKPDVFTRFSLRWLTHLSQRICHKVGSMGAFGMLGRLAWRRENERQLAWAQWVTDHLCDNESLRRQQRLSPAASFHKCQHLNRKCGACSALYICVSSLPAVQNFTPNPIFVCISYYLKCHTVPFAPRTLSHHQICPSLKKVFAPLRKSMLTLYRLLEFTLQRSTS